MPISKGTLVEWRYLAENTSMVSALGEYTPTEFIELLDYVEELEAKIAAQQTVALDASPISAAEK